MNTLHCFWLVYFVCLSVPEEIPITISHWAPDKDAKQSPYSIVPNFHQHRTLVCLFWSWNLHCAHAPANPTTARQKCFELLNCLDYRAHNRPQLASDYFLHSIKRNWETYINSSFSFVNLISIYSFELVTEKTKINYWPLMISYCCFNYSTVWLNAALWKASRHILITTHIIFRISNRAN